MQDLDYVVPPVAVRLRRIGNSRCGILELEERGGLTVEEDDLIAQLLADDDTAFVEAAKAADLIATAEANRTPGPEETPPVDGSTAGQLSIVEAFSVIKSAISGIPMEPAAQAISLRYAETIQQVARVFARSGQRNQEASVTAIIRTRLNRPQWTMEQTRRLDRTLFRGLNQLVLDEQTAENATPEPVSEAELGKQPAANGKRPGSSGRRSSGNSRGASPANTTAPPTGTNSELECSMP